MKTNKNYTIFIFALILVSIISCKKEKSNNDENTETAISVLQNDAEATRIYGQITDEINDVSAVIDSFDYQVNTKFLDSCVTISIDYPDTATWPKTMVLDFSGNCATINGNVLSGQIIVYQTARYRTDGMIRTITFNGFRINNNIVAGTKTIVNLGYVNGFRTYSVSIANGSLTTPEGEVIATRAAERTRVWIEGEGTQNRWDDVFSITGTTSGTTRNGREYTATIIEPLRVARNCRWIERGKIVTSIPDFPDVIIDFGDGSCDRIATVTINGNTRTISLHL